MRFGFLWIRRLPRSAGDELEVLDRVGDVGEVPVDARRVERLVQEFSCRTDERFTDAVFLIAGLFADEHHPCPDRLPAPKTVCSASRHKSHARQSEAASRTSSNVAS